MEITIDMKFTILFWEEEERREQVNQEQEKNYFEKRANRERVCQCI